MTTISATNPLETVQNQYKTKTAEKKDALGKDSFLKMLMAQLQHQDPLNPMQGADFSAQLAQFSSLEQLFNVNKNLVAMQDSSKGSSDRDVLGYIGKQVKTENNDITLKDGVGSGGYFSIDKPADVTATIYDDKGNEVKRLFIGHLDPGSHEIKWNGTNKTENKVDDGSYKFELSAIGEGGVTIPVKSNMEGKVTGIVYEENKPYLMIGDKKIDPAKIVEVWQDVEAKQTL